MATSPSWVSEKTGHTVSTVSPNELVRVLLHGAVRASAPLEVFSIPEHALRRILYRLKRRPGRQETTLWIDPSKKPQGKGKLSTVWRAASLRVGPKPPEFVARTNGFPLSTPLRVAEKVAWVFENPNASAHIDFSSLGAVLGIPLPIQIDANTGRKSFTGTSFAAVDPSFRVRVMTPSTSNPDLLGYLESYLPLVASEQGVPDVQEFVDTFRDEYEEYLKNSAEIGVEAHPQEIELEAGDSAEVAVDLYPREEGRTILAVAAIDPETEELISVSDLIGLTVAPGDVIYRDF